MQILEQNMTEGQNEFKKPRQPRAVASTPMEPTKGEEEQHFLFEDLPFIPGKKNPFAFPAKMFKPCRD